MLLLLLLLLLGTMNNKQSIAPKCGCAHVGALWQAAVFTAVQTDVPVDICVVHAMAAAPAVAMQPLTPS
jgi:hypothetical protein